MRAEHKQRTRTEVAARIVGRYADKPEQVADVLGDTIYHERTRLEKDRYGFEAGYLGWWKDLSRRVVTASAQTQERILHEVVLRFVDEVMGHFDPRIYDLATRMMPTSLALLLNSLDPRRAIRRPSRALDLKDNVAMKGEVEAVRRLANLGTLVVTPTHLSNLDSIVMGYGSYLMGLPPLTYGAGLNLFTNRLIGFFMRNLGAYRVDRRKKCGLYKEVLKEYATYSIELGYHNLFFPGGTRIRSGAVERKLKKGLLGTGLRAYTNNLKAGKARPNIYVCPCTLSYALTLEAETLIEDHLKEVGKSRYIIVDDEFSRPLRIANFLSDLLSLNSRIFLTWGAPLDPFGNKVDFQGRSLDPRGRVIDITKYVCREDEVVDDDQRDFEYTSELARSIVTSFEVNNRVQVTHIVAFATFILMRAARPGADLYRILREGVGPTGLAVADLIAGVDRLVERLQEMAREGEIKIDPGLENKPAEDLVKLALKVFRSYHKSTAMTREGDRVVIGNEELVYYYHNRLGGYGLEGVVAPVSAAAA